MRIVGLFPGFDPFGGIGSVGRIAAQVLNAAGPTGSEVEIVSFGSAFGLNHGSMREVRSKPAAVMASLKLRPADVVVVWHIGLLKLLPFIATRSTRVILFLFGVEAWREHRGLTLWMLRRVSRFLCDSAFAWERFIVLNPEFAGSDHEIVPLGLLAPEPKRASPSATPVATMIGRLNAGESYKGHTEVIEAWPLVVNQVPAAELWIIGEGDLKERLTELARSLGCSTSIRFLGAVPDAEKQAALNASRVLVLPSRGEGFGLVYVEAMRLGRPSIVSTLDAGREVVNPPEAGLAVDPSSRDELAVTIVRLLAGTDEWHTISAAARRRYETLYTEDHFKRRLSAAIGWTG